MCYYQTESWGPVPAALILSVHHSATSATQLGGRKQVTS